MRKGLWPPAGLVVILVVATLGAIIAWPLPVAAGEGGDGGGGSSGGSSSGSGAGASGGGVAGGAHGVATTGHAGGDRTGSAADYWGNRGWADTIRPSPQPVGRSPASQSEQDSAREAMRRGWVLPLEAVLTNVRQSVPGDVLRVTLRNESNGAWVYALTLLTPEGRYRDVIVDASSSRILRIKGH